MGSPPDIAQEDEQSKEQKALISIMSSLSDNLQMLSTKEDDEVTLSGMEVHHLTNNLSSVTEFATCDLDSPESEISMAKQPAWRDLLAAPGFQSKMFDLDHPSFDPTRVLLWLANEGHTILINPMLDLGADVRAKRNGCTALMLAVGKGHLETAQ